MSERGGPTEGRMEPITARIVAFTCDENASCAPAS
jgi:hypothetical protein